MYSTIEKIINLEIDTVNNENMHLKKGASAMEIGLSL